MYAEIAIGSPSARGTLVSEHDYMATLYELKAGVQMYRSVFLYDEDAVKFINKSGSIKNFVGKRYIDEVPIDIDKGQQTDEYTLQQAQFVLYELNELGLKEENYQIYFSGTGYHINISGECFNIEPSSDLPFILKQTMKELIDYKIDLSVYTKSAIIRSPYSFNNKSSLYKVPLTATELNTMSVQDIHLKANFDMNKNQKFLREIIGDGSLERYVKTEVPEVRSMQSVQEPRNVVPCVQTMYKKGPSQGNRNNTVLRMASHFRRHGIPSDATKASLLHWNNNQLDPQVIIDKVEATYNHGYQYGCKDSIMSEYCDPKCVYYKHKDYLVDVHTREQLQAQLEERLSTDYTGKSIDLAKMFGLAEKDCIIYPGELVTIFGPTGSNKTTLAQNIVLGYDFKEDIINTDWQLPTLFLSLELSGHYMHRRNLQIVSGLSKDAVNDDVHQIGEDYADQLSHLTIQTIATQPEAIAKKIKEMQPTVVVIDYIDLLECPPHLRGEYEQVRYISHYLSNLAVNMDIIIIQISQVSRDYSRNEILDIYAGKGSGAIENASRKVIGINGRQDNTAKEVSLFKNSDGDLFNVKLNWTPSFRLPKEPS
tara:strand:+ start:5242 stop:7026 length:1785 start_codon:yes stop_codon:yes gene_type:complete